LADKAIGITRIMRKSEDVSIRAIDNATDMIYRLDDVVSKQAVMKEIHELDIPRIIPEPKEKRKKKEGPKN